MRLPSGLVVVLAALAFGATPAAAQSPVGIVRPDEPASKPPLQLGSELFAGNCVSCHGIAGRGVGAPAARRGTGAIRGQGPALLGVGALATDFYLRTGYMPLEKPTDQPERRRPPFDDREIRALVAYVASLQGGPPIPRPEPQKGSLSQGLHVFTEHCAGCHQVAAQGGFVTGARVPPLGDATPVQIAEAVRIGPYVMPRFPKSQISDRQLNSVVRYVLASQHPADRGGWGIGNLGPVPEGIVTWLIAAIALVGVCRIIGRGLRA